MNDAFDRFSVLFHQDCDLYGSKWEEMIAIVLSMLGNKRAEELKIYLHEILNSDLSDHDLMGIWENSRSDIGFGEAQNYRRFLELSHIMADRYTQR
jgi:hypothetical protein